MTAHPCGSTVHSSPRTGGPVPRHRTRAATGNAGGPLFRLWPLACRAVMVWMRWGMRGMDSDAMSGVHC